jgi:hypothetical protein
MGLIDPYQPVTTVCYQASKNRHEWASPAERFGAFPDAIPEILQFGLPVSTLSFSISRFEKRDVVHKGGRIPLFQRHKMAYIHTAIRLT